MLTYGISCVIINIRSNCSQLNNEINRGYSMKFRINMPNGKIFIFTIILFCIGVFNSVYNFYGCKEFYMLSIIIGFIPFTVLIIRNTIAQSKKNIKYYSIVTPTLIGVFIAIMFLNVIVIKILDLNYINTDVGDYQKFLRLNNYSNNKYIKHFPKEVPENANKIEFREEDGFTKKFSLSYILEPEQIKLVESNANKREHKEIIKNYEQSMETMQQFNIPKEVLRILEIKDNEEKTTNFKIYLIETTDVEYLTHGYSYGVGINFNNNRVIYFSNKW